MVLFSGFFYCGLSGRSILASNWEGKLTTIKADDVKRSKGEVHSSKVKYIVKKGKPYVWIPENDPRNVNTVIDERGSLAVTSPFPGPLARILKSMERSPSRIALIGDVPVTEEKVQSALERHEEPVLSKHKAISESTYAVSRLLSSANLKSTSPIENLKELLDGSQSYSIYKFDIRFCTFVDGHGNAKEIDLENIQASETDPLGCITFCPLIGMVLGRVPNPDAHSANSMEQFLWKEFRLPFPESACDMEKFRHLLVNMEENATNKVSSYSGISV